MGGFIPPSVDNGETMKTDKSFRLNQNAKRLLANIDNKDDYLFFKRVSIEKQLIKERAKHTSKKSSNEVSEKE